MFNVTAKEFLVLEDGKIIPLGKYTVVKLKGVSDKNGNTILEYKYIKIEKMKHAFLVMDCSKRYGVFSFTGEPIMRCYYEYIQEFNDGYLVKNKKLECGFFSLSGTPILSLKWSSIEPLGTGLKVKNKEGNYAYYSLDGECIIPFKKGIIGANNVLIVHEFNETMSIFNFNGKIILPSIYRAIELFYNDEIAKVSNSRGKFGIFFLSSKQFILNCEWDRIFIHDNFFIVERNGLKGLYSLKGDAKLKCEWNDIKKPCLHLPYVIVESKKGFGIYSIDGKEIVKANHKKIKFFKTYAIVSRKIPLFTKKISFPL